MPARHPELILDLFDARNEPASMAYRLLWFEGDEHAAPPHALSVPDPRDWSPLKVYTGAIAQTEEFFPAPDADPAPPTLKKRLLDALITTTKEAAAGLGRTGVDAMTDVGVEGRLWAADMEKFWRLLGDGLPLWSPTDLPAGKNTLLITSVLRDGERESKVIERIWQRFTDIAGVVGVVALFDMDWGGPDYIAERTRVDMVTSVFSLYDMLETLRTASRITDEYAAYCQRWLSDPEVVIPPDERIPFRAP